MPRKSRYKFDRVITNEERQQNNFTKENGYMRKTYEQFADDSKNKRRKRKCSL